MSSKMDSTDTASNLPAWYQSMPESRNKSGKTSFSRNYDNRSPEGVSFNACAIPPIQTTAAPESESDYISSPIPNIETSVELWDTPIDGMDYSQWDLSMDQLAYHIGLSASDLRQDVQITPNHTRIPSRPSPATSESTGGLLGDTKEKTRKLRTASRKSKNSGEKKQSPIHTQEGHQIMLAQKRARDCHNKAEKQYRDKLNSQYTMLLEMVPMVSEIDSEGSGSTDLIESVVGMPKKAHRGNQGVSRGEILVAARHYIQVLERKGAELQQEREQLLRRMLKMRPDEQCLLEHK